MKAESIEVLKQHGGGPLISWEANSWVVTLIDGRGIAVLASPFMNADQAKAWASERFGIHNWSNFHHDWIPTQAIPEPVAIEEIVEELIAEEAAPEPIEPVSEPPVEEVEPIAIEEPEIAEEPVAEEPEVLVEETPKKAPVKRKPRKKKVASVDPITEPDAAEEAGRQVVRDFGGALDRLAELSGDDESTETSDS